MASLRPLRGTPAPTLSRRFQVRGSQRGPLLMIMNVDGGADAVINGGSKTV
jgi:hypothetical protein